MPIYTFSDGRQARVSEDRTTAIIEKTELATQAADLLAKNYDRIIAKNYREIRTTPNMIRRALRGFGGEEIIFIGISPTHPDVGDSAIMRLHDQTNDKVTIMAGRGEV